MTTTQARLVIDGTFYRPVKITLSAQGTRTHDKLEAVIVGEPPLSQGDLVQLVLDKPDVIHLAAAFSMERHTRDESGYGRDATSSMVTYGDGYAGAAAILDGSDDFINFGGASWQDFDHPWEITFWLKTDLTGNTRNDIIMHGGRWNLHIINNTLTFDKLTSPTTDLDHSATVNDDTWHLIRIRQVESGTVELYVDDTRNTVSVSGWLGMSSSDDLSFGDPSGSGNSDFLVDNCRMYFGGVLSDSDVARLTNGVIHPWIMKFGGRIANLQRKQTTTKLVAYSHGREMSLTDLVRYGISEGSPESIIASIISDQTSLNFLETGVTTNRIVPAHNTHGKVVETILKLIQFGNIGFYTDPLGHFILTPEDGQRTIPTVYKHGDNSTILVDMDNDQKLITDFILDGGIVGAGLSANGEFRANYYSASSVSSTINTNRTITSIRYGSNNTWYAWYRINGQEISSATITNGSITFSGTTMTLPSSVVNNMRNFLNGNITHRVELKVDYVYSTTGEDLRVRAQITPRDGIRRSYTMTNRGFTDRDDAKNFATNYLDYHSVVHNRVELKVNQSVTDLRVGDNVRVINRNKKLDEVLVVQSVKTEWPIGVTTAQLGEHQFGSIEEHNNIFNDIHDLKSAVDDIEDAITPDIITTPIYSRSTTIEEIGLIMGGILTLQSNVTSTSTTTEDIIRISGRILADTVSSTSTTTEFTEIVSGRDITDATSSTSATVETVDIVSGRHLTDEISSTSTISESSDRISGRIINDDITSISTTTSTVERTTLRVVDYDISSISTTTEDVDLISGRETIDTVTSVSTTTEEIIRISGRVIEDTISSTSIATTSVERTTARLVDYDILSTSTVTEDVTRISGRVVEDTVSSTSTVTETITQVGGRTIEDTISSVSTTDEVILPESRWGIGIWGLSKWGAGETEPITDEITSTSTVTEDVDRETPDDTTSTSTVTESVDRISGRDVTDTISSTSTTTEDVERVSGRAIEDDISSVSTITEESIPEPRWTSGIWGKSRWHLGEPLAKSVISSISTVTEEIIRVSGRVVEDDISSTSSTNETVDYISGRVVEDNVSSTSTTLEDMLSHSLTRPWRTAAHFYPDVVYASQIVDGADRTPTFPCVYVQDESTYDWITATRFFTVGPGNVRTTNRYVRVFQYLDNGAANETAAIALNLNVCSEWDVIQVDAFTVTINRNDTLVDVYGTGANQHDCIRIRPEIEGAAGSSQNIPLDCIIFNNTTRTLREILEWDQSHINMDANQARPLMAAFPNNVYLVTTDDPEMDGTHSVATSLFPTSHRGVDTITANRNRITSDEALGWCDDHWGFIGITTDRTVNIVGTWQNDITSPCHSPTAFTSGTAIVETTATVRGILYRKDSVTRQEVEDWLAANP